MSFLLGFFLGVAASFSLIVFALVAVWRFTLKSHDYYAANTAHLLGHHQQQDKGSTSPTGPASSATSAASSPGKSKGKSLERDGEKTAAEKPAAQSLNEIEREAWMKVVTEYKREHSFGLDLLQRLNSKTLQASSLAQSRSNTLIQGPDS